MNSLDTHKLAALEQAAHWYSLLRCEDAGAGCQAAWQVWLEASPDNRWAWAQAQGLQQQWSAIPTGVSGRALELAEQERLGGRCRALKGFVLLAGACALGWDGYRTDQQRAWLADYSSATGERPKLTLADGSQLQLNTDSAVDVVYDTRQRLIVLRRGELLLSTAADPAGRPLYVQTPQGRVQALGTRFSVRLVDEKAQVAVFEHRVRITPGRGREVLLSAGEQCRFDAFAASPVQPLEAGQDAWTRGLLIANDQSLPHFLHELGRYRAGWLRCDPAVADLRISGTFPLNDTDQALRALANSLPVRIERRTRFWVTVTAR